MLASWTLYGEAVSVNSIYNKETVSDTLCLRVSVWVLLQGYWFILLLPPRDEDVGGDESRVTKPYKIARDYCDARRVASYMAFRRWTNSVLKQYLIKGYAVNERIRKQQISELRQLVQVLGRTLQQHPVPTRRQYPRCPYAHNRREPDARKGCHGESGRELDQQEQWVNQKRPTLSALFLWEAGWVCYCNGYYFFFNHQNFPIVFSCRIRFVRRNQSFSPYLNINILTANLGVIAPVLCSAKVEQISCISKRFGSFNCNFGCNCTHFCIWPHAHKNVILALNAWSLSLCWTSNWKEKLCNKYDRYKKSHATFVAAWDFLFYNKSLSVLRLLHLLEMPW